MNKIQKLSSLFADFPGIGPRQAKRFVYFLLTRNQEYLENFTNLVKSIKKDIRVCQSCFRIFITENENMNDCDICLNKNRDRSTITIVSRDTDLEHIEKTGVYNGLYFVLGGTIPILEPSPEKRVRIKDLLSTIKRRSDELREIVLALNANPEGENTTDFLQKNLENIVQKHPIKISLLGRGLSTGTELEYSDNETLKNAFKNRK